MAITIEFDKLQGHSAVRTENGWEITRVAIVKGLTGNAYERLVNAVDSAAVIAAGMPQMYDSHPAKSAVLLREIRPKPIDTETVEVTLIYRDSGVTIFPREEAQIAVGASVQQVETNKDKSNNDLKVSHTWTTAEKARHYGDSVPTGLASPDIQGGMVTQFKPQTTFEYAKRQNYSPDSDAMAYVGKVNNASWKGGAAGTWLCTGIVGRSNDNGDHYDVTYSFQYQGGGWNPYYTYLMPDGKPPETTDSNSRKQADLYDTANFAGLPV